MGRFRFGRGWAPVVNNAESMKHISIAARCHTRRKCSHRLFQECTAIGMSTDGRFVLFVTFLLKNRIFFIR